MKFIRLIAILVFFYATPSLALDRKPEGAKVSVISVKREVFYFKASKEFIGALVEVYDKNGALIHSEKVLKRKTIVDFFHRDPGSYTIKITKGDMVEEFECTFNLR